MALKQFLQFWIRHGSVAYLLILLCYLLHQSSFDGLADSPPVEPRTMLHKVADVATHSFGQSVHGTVGIQHRKQCNFLILSQKLLGHFINDESAERGAH